MIRRAWNDRLVIFVSGSLCGLVLYAILGASGGVDRSLVHAQDNTPRQDFDLAALQQEVELLKGKTPGQAHAMMDVDYHFSNLWFAARAKNWPLADFYWKETVSHMRWAVRIIPVRKDNAGNDIKLQEILESIEQSPYMQIGQAIATQNVDEFEVLIVIC